MAKEQNYQVVDIEARFGKDFEIKLVDSRLPWVMVIDCDQVLYEIGPDFNLISIRNTKLFEDAISYQKPDIIVLDPNSTGLRVLDLKEFAPVIVVTSHDDPSGQQQWASAEEGADIVLEKSSKDELLAPNILALKRRVNTSDAPIQKEALEDESVLNIGSLRIEFDKMTVFLSDNKLTLPPKEWAILEVLAKNANKVVRYEDLIANVWGYEFDKHSVNSLRVHLLRLRKKIPDFIETRRQVGYILVDPH